MLQALSLVLFSIVGFLMCVQKPTRVILIVREPDPVTGAAGNTEGDHTENCLAGTIAVVELAALSVT